MAQTPGRLVYRFLSRVSGPQAGSGSDLDLNTLSGAATPAPSVFEFNPTHPILLSQIHIFIYDVTVLSLVTFGGVTALTNGCTLKIVNTAGTLLDLTAQQAFKRNEDLAMPSSFFWFNDTSDVVEAIILFDEPLLLNPGERIQWTNRDNLTGLDFFRIFIKGKYNY